MDGYKWRGSLLLAILFVLSTPATARAHSAIAGLEGFGGGLLHPLTSPAHLLILVALGLLTGQRKPLDLKILFAVFAPCLALALLLTMTGAIKSVDQPILVGLALCAATSVALEKPIPPLACRALFAAAALAIGLDSGPEKGSAAIVIKTLLGTWLMVIFLLFDVAYYTSLATRKHWPKVGVRILGSWIIAISLLMLAFSLI